jgi:hypothetical protein
MYKSVTADGSKLFGSQNLARHNNGPTHPTKVICCCHMSGNVVVAALAAELMSFELISYEQQAALTLLPLSCSHCCSLLILLNKLQWLLKR